MRFLLLGIFSIAVLVCHAQEQAANTALELKKAFIANAVQVTALDPLKPVFVPTHPRVSTTIHFPGEIGTPSGNGFTEDPEKLPGEYVVSWVGGEQFFTVIPLEGAGACNLNIPYKGQIYVLYFYPVTKQQEAAASVNLVDRPLTAATAAAVTPVEIKRQEELPASEYVAVTPARLLGFMDKLKVVHATSPGLELESLGQAMKLDVAVSKAEQDGNPGMSLLGVCGIVTHSVSDAGLYQFILVRSVRDRRMNCLGFICLVRNQSTTPIAFDLESFSARSGSTLLAQVLADAPAIVGPGETREVYFIVQANRNFPLMAQNEWRISAQLLSPRLNPGAAISAKYAQVREQKEVTK